jgi:hypothetical protein
MKIIAKGLSGCLIVAAVLAALVFITLLFLQGGVWLGEKVLPWLQRFSAATLIVVALVFLPLALFWRTRRFAARGMLSAASVFGMTLWLWGLVLTYNLWGGAAVLLGLFLLGVGVVPMAMIATLLAAMWPTLGKLLLLGLLTIATRRFGLQLLAQMRAREQKVYELEIL